MHVAVLGGGVVGVTTAYFLAQKGCEVTLLERGPSLASATSYANGGQLSYSYTDSLARPEFLPRIPALVLGRDPAIRVSLLRNFGLYSWGVRFLSQCTHARARANTLAVLRLALRSAALLEQLQTVVGLEFAYRRAGKLVVLATQDEVAGAEQRAQMKRNEGCETRLLGYDDAVALEPALASMRQTFAGAIYSEDDEVGDAHVFSHQLAAWLEQQRSVSVRLEETVLGLDVRSNRLDAVLTEKGRIVVDAAVVSLGPWSRDLLRPHGIDPHIYPVRGYSVTLPPGRGAPAISVTNLEHRIVFSTLDDNVRIAGFADFVGRNGERDKKRQQRLFETAARIAPEAADYTAIERREWAGMRPVTPDSRPVVGRSRVDGVYLNVGHGVLGWTLACATGHDVAEAIARKS